MLHDLDLTIRELVLNDPDGGIADAFEMTADQVSFATPDEAFRSSVQRPTMNAFLFDVRENWALRADSPRDVMTNGQPVRTSTRTFVDCSYLISFWTAAQDVPKPLDEHRALGLIAMSLLRHASIPQWARHGAFANDNQLLRGQLAEQTSLQASSEFWQALGGSPRTLLRYSLTASVPSRPDTELTHARPPEQRVFTINANEAARPTWPDASDVPLPTTIQE